MTNHPDETNSLRERVDEAISWFTGTDDPAPVEPDTETPDESLAPEAGPVAGSEGTEPAVSEPAQIAGDVVEQPAEESAYVAEQPAADVEPVASAEPVVAEPVVAEPWSEPVAEPVVEAAPLASTETWPGASFPKRAVTPEPAPEPVADEAPAPVDEEVEAAEPVVVEEPIVVAPVADEPVTDEPVIADKPVAETWSGSSDIDEPTRIHPIDASLGAPIVDESAADDVAPTEPVAPVATAWQEPVEDDFTEPLAADAAADAEAARQRSLFRDVVPPIGTAVGGAAALGAVPAAEKTAVLDAQESARLRREERAARDRQLGKVIASQEEDEPLVTPFTAPSTYKPLPSLGLFLFRLIVAAVVGIRAWQHITHLTATRSMWEATVLQSPGTIAWVQIGLEIAIAVMLVLGLGTRIAGVLLLVLSMTQLLFVQWGAVNPFQPGATDFIGVVDVLLAGVGLLLATVGGGRAAIDGAIHTGNVKRKNSKLFA